MSFSSSVRRYRVRDVLGRGSFGTVYRAERLDPEAPETAVALKVLHDDVQARTSEIERLRDEARIVGHLHHPAIVQVDGLVRLEGRWAVVMEFVEGVTLKDALDHAGPLPPSVALEIVAELASALHHAYAVAQTDSGQPLRVLHRDLKPGNVQVSSTGAAKLLDFGLAGVEQPPDASLAVLGSVPYLAPERLQLVDTHKGDIFSLGASLLELIHRRLPGKPSRDAASHRSRVEAGLTGLPHAPLEPLLRRLLSFEPGDRPTAATLEVECRALRARIGGMSLAAWAGDVVPRLMEARRPVTEELSGLTLSETLGNLGSVDSLADLAGAARTWDELDLHDPPPPAGPAAETVPARPWVSVALVALSTVGLVGLSVTALAAGAVALAAAAWLLTGG